VTPRYARGALVALISSLIPLQASQVFDDISTVLTVGRGNELQKKGDYDKARQLYDVAIARDPTAYGPYVLRALVFMRQKKWDLALQDWNTVIRLKPIFFEATMFRGDINGYLGNYSRALSDYDILLKVLPPSWQEHRAWTLNGRAWIRATCPDAALRNGKQAVADAKGACNIIHWSQSAYIDTLAAAFAETGDFDSAIKFENRAIERALRQEAHKSSEERQSAIAACQQHLASYEQNRPYRDVKR
jgi:tetratricopeptide (TPR) repeat protein